MIFQFFSGENGAFGRGKLGCKCSQLGCYLRCFQAKSALQLLLSKGVVSVVSESAG